MKKICKTCKWFNNDTGEKGECRKKSPVNAYYDPQHEGVFPRMHINDWCGDWKPK